MTKQAPWDEQTEGFISDLEPTISEKYNISLRSLLLNPDKYIDKKDLSTTIDGIISESEAYFSSLMDDLKDEQTKLTSEMESADSQYREVDSVITNKAAAARVPYIKPLFLSRDPDKEELILVDKYEETYEALLGKLVNAANYVADVSALYKNYRLGSWLFSGQKNYVFTINPPTSPILIIENGRDQIDEMLNDIASRASQ
jgi:hypothetical protein